MVRTIHLECDSIHPFGSYSYLVCLIRQTQMEGEFQKRNYNIRGSIGLCWRDYALCRTNLYRTTRPAEPSKAYCYDCYDYRHYRLDYWFITFKIFARHKEKRAQAKKCPQRHREDRLANDYGWRCLHHYSTIEWGV